LSGRGRPAIPPGPYLIVGLARTGVAAARLLTPHGEVIGCDSGEPERARELEGVEVHLGTDGADLVRRVRTVVKSPGVPQDAPAVLAAREWGVEVVGELELAWRSIPNPFVAVTGTNGKTTTAELLGAMFRQAGMPVAVAGNVGTPLSSLAGELDRRAVVVCEASSFQLEDSSAFAPECAVLVNLEEDHLDRHGTLEAYRDAKLRVFANQRKGDSAVVPEGFDAPELRHFPGTLLTFGGNGDVALVNGAIHHRGAELIGPRVIRLRGVHNLENAMAASAAALAYRVDPAPIAAALRTFPGVPHRLEEVADRDGVLFVNDSKATNPASAKRGIEAFEGGVHAILGGSLKGGGFETLRPAVSDRCRACYLIGEAAERLAADLDGTVPLERSGDLESAVRAAAAAAEPGEVVLLSPACASFDSYRDFEARGEHFRNLVETLS
jgi:UDP-N-acetylmuramoylalanine--D-glutamate ligase